MNEYPTVSVDLNHLDAMGLMMLIEAAEQDEGLSIAMVKTKPKIQEALGILLGQMFAQPSLPSKAKRKRTAKPVDLNKRFPQFGNAGLKVMDGKLYRDSCNHHVPCAGPCESGGWHDTGIEVAP